MAFDPIKTFAEATATVQKVATGAREEVEKVTSQIQTGVDPVVKALTDFQRLLGAIGAGARDNLDRLMRESMDKLGQLADGIEDVGGQLTRLNVWVAVTVDGQSPVVKTDPTEVYRAIIAAVEPQNAKPPKHVEIECGGLALFPAMAPLAANKDAMRAALLNRVGISLSAPVLVKNPADWVIACAIICFTICVLAVMAPPAFGVGAVLFGIAAALLVSVTLGYEVDIEVEQKSSAGITLPGDIHIESGPAVKLKLTRRT